MKNKKKKKKRTFWIELRFYDRLFVTSAEVKNVTFNEPTRFWTIFFWFIPKNCMVCWKKFNFIQFYYRIFRSLAIKSILRFCYLLKSILFTNQTCACGKVMSDCKTFYFKNLSIIIDLHSIVNLVWPHCVHHYNFVSHSMNCYQIHATSARFKWHFHWKFHALYVIIVKVFIDIMDSIMTSFKSNEIMYRHQYRWHKIDMHEKGDRK